MLARCLNSLVQNIRQPDEIIVVDNGSRELPENICAVYPNVQLLGEAEPGPGPARNKGVATAKGDILAFIDADCLADPNWLAAAEQALSDPKAQILGGDVRIAYVNPDRLTMLEAYESIYAYRMDRYIAREGYTGTGNLVIRPDVAEAVGPLAGIGVAEDKDWGQRATAQGYTIQYVPEMKVYHPARTDFAGMRAKWDRHIAHEYIASKGLAAARFRFILKTAAMALSPLAEFPRILTCERITGARSRALAFIGLTRIRFYRARVMLGVLMGGGAEKLSGGWNR